MPSAPAGVRHARGSGRDAPRVRSICCILPGIGIAGADPTSRQYSFATASRNVTWELHTEFVIITWRADLTDAESRPEDLGSAAVGDGMVIAAMRIDVIADTSIPERLVPGFNFASLCLADVKAGNAQVATDFVPDAQLFTRFELAAGGLTVLRRSVIVRRLLEIETYRTMALLGLPLAHAAEPELRTIERARCAG